MLRKTEEHVKRKRERKRERRRERRGRERKRRRRRRDRKGRGRRRRRRTRMVRGRRTMAPAEVVEVTVAAARKQTTDRSRQLPLQSRGSPLRATPIQTPSSSQLRQLCNGLAMHSK